MIAAEEVPGYHDRLVASRYLLVEYAVATYGPDWALAYVKEAHRGQRDDNSDESVAAAVQPRRPQPAADGGDRKSKRDRKPVVWAEEHPQPVHVPVHQIKPAPGAAHNVAGMLRRAGLKTESAKDLATTLCAKVSEVHGAVLTGHLIALQRALKHRRELASELEHTRDFGPLIGHALDPMGGSDHDVNKR